MGVSRGTAVRKGERPTMAGAAPTAKPAPFLKPLDLLDRGVLLAESALSLVIVVLMLFAAVSDSSIKLIQNLPLVVRAGAIGGLWLLLFGLKLAGPASGVSRPGVEEESLAQVTLRRLFKREVPREKAATTAVLEELVGFCPSPRDRANLGRVLQATRKVMDRARDLVEKKLESGEMDRLADRLLAEASPEATAGSSSISAPESSASIPAP